MLEEGDCLLVGDLVFVEDVAYEHWVIIIEVWKGSFRARENNLNRKKTNLILRFLTFEYW